MKRKFVALLCCCTFICSAGCTPTVKKEQRPLRIGSITFTEHILLAEMQKVLIEQNLNYKVEHIPNFASSAVLHQSMLNGEIDISTRYLGTEMSGALELPSYPHDSPAALALVRTEFASRFAQTVLDPLGFQNTYAFALRREQAERFRIATISDLHARAPAMKLGTDTTWLERSADGYRDFIRAYGFQFGEAAPMEVSLLYKALRDRQLDVALAYSTDPRLKSYDLLLLRDDRHFFPPYDAVIIVRNDALANYSGLREELNKLSGLLDNDTIVELNYQVDELKRPPREVAREFLQQRNLLNH